MVIVHHQLNYDGIATQSCPIMAWMPLIVLEISSIAGTKGSKCSLPADPPDHLLLSPSEGVRWGAAAQRVLGGAVVAGAWLLWRSPWRRLACMRTHTHLAW
jgi:hypothetical protein